MTRALLAGLALALALPAAAREVPYLTGRVVDEARVLDDASAAALNATLKAYEAKTGRQIAVLTLPSLEGEPLEDFSIKVARTWKLGRKGANDGVLILVARDDHKARIEVGYGLEGPLTDAASGRIIRDQMVPHFRANDYAGGLRAGVDAVIGTLEGSYTPPSGGTEVARVRVHGPSDGLGDSLLEKLMISAFVFGIIGLFEVVGLLTPGMGWILYFFLIPFWAAFPMAIWGAKFGSAVLLAHLVLFPILKKLLAKTDLAKKFAVSSRGGRGGGFYSSGWSSGSSSSDSGWSSGGSDSFSGGGGDFGGGGASGSW